MKDWIIKSLLAWLADITVEQWQTALHWVRKANKDLPGVDKGAERKAAVVDMVKTLLPQIKTSALNLAIEVAVAFVRKSK